MYVSSRLFVFPLLLSVAAFAETRSGSLVDFHCYRNTERNVNPTDTLTAVDRDGGRQLRYCSPNLKTKVFALVEPDGTALTLDTAGNTKAAGLVRQNGPKSPLHATVTGQVSEHNVKVFSVVLAQN